MTSKIKSILALCAASVLSLCASGCASDGSLTPAAQTVLTKAEAVAYTVAAAYETVNTATGGTLTTSLLNSALVATHNTTVEDYQLVDAGGKAIDTTITAKLSQAAISAQANAQANGLSPAGQQAAVATALSDPQVIAAAAAAAPAALQVPASS